jgi:uncharacterized LabA/DUF88 family protein
VARARYHGAMARTEPGIDLFVDNSNVLLEGRRFAEMKRKGKTKLSPYLDQSYEIDWGKFLYVVKEKDSRRLAELPILYGSRPPPQDSVWDRIRDEGFDVKLFDRNIRNKEKGVDMEMGLDISERILTVKNPGTILIAAGDADYIPVVARAASKGWTVEVWFWSNAAEDLRKAVSTRPHRFCPLDASHEYLKLGGKVAFPP